MILSVWSRAFREWKQTNPLWKNYTKFLAISMDILKDHREGKNIKIKYEKY